jgi:hypothetical protein
MTLDWWSTLRLLDGSARARYNAEQAIRDSRWRRVEQRIAVRRIEREYAARRWATSAEPVARRFG